MLRFVTLFALVAAAFAEPEAQMVHHANGAVVPDDTMAVKLARSQHLTAKFGMPLAYSLPYTYQRSILPYAYTYPAAYTNAHIIAKREAEAKADPLTIYSHAYNYGAWPYTTGYARTIAPYTYTTAQNVMPYTYTYPAYTNAHLIAKREAEAEADPLTIYSNAYNYGAWPYTTGYARTIAPYTYTTAQNIMPYTYTYPAYTNAHLIAKREAEAEADPLTIYSNAYNAYNYAAWPYTTGYARTIAPYTYTTAQNIMPYTYRYPAYTIAK